MSVMMKSIVAVGFGLALALLTAMPAKADHDCKPIVAERLNRLNVEIRKKGNDEYVERIDAWISLRSCEGHVVMEITPHCYVRQIYGRGECASVVP